MGDRQIAWGDFDAMLGDMERELGRIAQFFGFETSNIASIAAGPIMSRYSKAMEYDYSTNLRRELIAEASERYASDIDTALAMLQSAADKSSLLERALSRARES
jgi:hypothetical protein